MKLVSKNDNLPVLMQKVKKRTGTLITNLYIDPEKLSHWQEKNLIFLDYTEEGFLLFRKEKSFYHLYYYTASLEKLRKLVTDYLPTQEEFVIDLIGKAESLSSLTEIFYNVGFKKYKQLDRYLRINNDDKVYYQSSNEVTLATVDDARVIYRLFTDNFDIFAEQVPDLEELEKLIEENKVLVIKFQDIIKGFLVRTFNGQTTLLNNFLVDKPFRGEKIGSKLLQHYISESKGVKRMILWVIADNEFAIQVYTKYGYKKENLVDYVLMRSNNGENN